MGGGADWMPTLVVVAVFLVALVVGFVALRAAGRRRERVELAANRAVERRAKSALVAADDAVREAVVESGYAEAEFGPAEAETYRVAVDDARRHLREAFVLQQRLDDEIPDTAAERRSWSRSILGLAESAHAAVRRADDRLGELRSGERGAAERLPAFERDADALSARHDEVARALDALGARYADGALEPYRAAAARAADALQTAAAALAEVRAQRAAARPADPASRRAAAALSGASHDLDRAGRAERELRAASEEVEETVAELDGALAAARRERDGADEAGPRAELDAAVADAAARLLAVVGGAGAIGGMPGAAVGDGPVSAAPAGSPKPDPAAQLSTLRRVGLRLDAARAAVRTAQHRLDGARGALPGALRIARSQIRAAETVVAARRVGADARTRLAEAERQLRLAEDEADPVAALDAARRAASRAADAEALARYDAG